jgi:hypothetical protein
VEPSRSLRFAALSSAQFVVVAAAVRFFPDSGYEGSPVAVAAWFCIPLAIFVPLSGRPNIYLVSLAYGALSLVAVATTLASGEDVGLGFAAWGLALGLALAIVAIIGRTARRGPSAPSFDLASTANRRRVDRTQHPTEEHLHGSPARRATAAETDRRETT